MIGYSVVIAQSGTSARQVLKARPLFHTPDIGVASSWLYMNGFSVIDHQTHLVYHNLAQLEACTGPI